MNDWDNIFGEVPASFEARILDTLATLEEDKPVRRLGRRGMTSLIAAAAAIVVLGGTALATGFFGLREVEVDNPYGEVGAATQQDGSESLLIALQGYPDSSEYKATAEWMAFLAGYDQDRALFRAAQENPPELDARYALYNVYTQEMADKLDEITEKYGLTLHCRMVTCPDVASLYASCGVDGFIRGDYKVSGFAYDDGSFLFNGSDASEDGLVPAFQFGRYMKGVFSEVVLNVGDAGLYDAWEYVTGDGVCVYLYLGPEKCVLMADLPESFISVNVLAGSATAGPDGAPVMTREKLEAFANTFDFTALG